MSPSGKVHGLRKADSAGVPWAGRNLTEQPFARDDGSAPPAVAQALAELAATRGDGAGDPAQTLRAQARVTQVIAGARLLVPIVAVLGEGNDLVAAEGDKNADMALAMLRGKDGRKALPAFTSVQTCAAWDPTARPVPVQAERAAAAAVDEGCDVMVIDPAGPVVCVIGRPATWALGQGQPWTPAPFDPAVQQAIGQVADAVDGVLSCRCEAGRSAETAVVLTVASGLSRQGLADVVAAVGALLSGVEIVAERVDSIELRVLSA